LHSLVVNDETNLLRLITPWLDNSCQIKPKRATTTFSQTFRELNTPRKNLTRKSVLDKKEVH